MSHKRGESNNGDRASAAGRYSETSWFRNNVKKRRRRTEIAKASRRRNRKQ